MIKIVGGDGGTIKEEGEEENEDVEGEDFDGMDWN
jgi:hypothetical protein